MFILGVQIISFEAKNVTLILQLVLDVRLVKVSKRDC